jgi:hypothetical protein
MTKWTKQERATIDRAYECIKKHPELGRIYKKDLVPLESCCDNGLVRNFTVRDNYSKRIISGGQTSYTYYHAAVD